MRALRQLLVQLAIRLVSIPFSLANRLRPAFRPSLPSSIVVVKPCCIGDVLMATAVVGQLRRAYPQARLAFAVGDWSRRVVEGNPLIDEIVPCGRVAAGAPYGLRDYLGLVRRLRRGRYDLAVVLERSAVLSLLPFLAGIPHRVGIDSGGRGFSLTIRVPWRGQRHEAELYLDTVRALGLSIEEPRASFYPSDADRDWAARVRQGPEPGPHSSGAASAPRRVRVALHAGGGSNPGMVLTAKQWLPERFAELARRLLEAGAEVVLLGGSSDRPVSDRVRSILGSEGEPILDLTGATTLGQLGAVISSCDLFVGNDSGPTHLAAAVGTPVVAIFGPSTPQMYGPLGPHTHVIYRPVECSPCFVNGSFARHCRHYRCQHAISVDDVWEAVVRLLDLSPSPAPSDDGVHRA